MTTILPPNAPSCFFGAVSDSDGVVVLKPNFRPGIFSASSNHTGGVNCALLDGSVQFVSDTINALNSGRSYDDWSPAPTGESLYGVWGAMGTPSAGESKHL